MPKHGSTLTACNVTLGGLLFCNFNVLQALLCCLFSVWELVTRTWSLLETLNKVTFVVAFFLLFLCILSVTINYGDQNQAHSSGRQGSSQLCCPIPRHRKQAVDLGRGSENNESFLAIHESQVSVTFWGFRKEGKEEAVFYKESQAKQRETAAVHVDHIH